MTDVGVTLGVEEEFHLVDASTGGLADAPQVVAAAQRELGLCAQAEISTAQLEIVTPVCTSLAHVRSELERLRRGAASVAAEHGVAVLACGTHPTATWRDQRLTEDERYERLYERWGLLALQQLIAGCHVHVSVPDPELAVQVLNHLRPDLPVLVALSGSSPYWEGVDTGYASYRTQWFGRWPVTGLPEVFADRQAYDDAVRALVRAGIVGDASHLYWDVRPSTRYPTVEIRVADTMPLLDDVVLHAGLARALVRAAAADALAGLPVPALRPELGRAARWRAARFGLEGDLLDARTGEVCPAREVVGAAGPGPRATGGRRRLGGIGRAHRAGAGPWHVGPPAARGAAPHGRPSRCGPRRRTGGEAVRVGVLGRVSSSADRLDGAGSSCGHAGRGRRARWGAVRQEPTLRAPNSRTSRSRS